MIRLFQREKEKKADKATPAAKSPKPKPLRKMPPTDYRLHSEKMRALNLKMRNALRQYHNWPWLELPTKEVPLNKTHELDWDTIVDGVIAMIGALNLYSGSSGTFELYRLNLAYLVDYKLRKELNELIEYRRPDLPTFR